VIKLLFKYHKEEKKKEMYNFCMNNFTIKNLSKTKTETKKNEKK
jgi:hypothetical protein